MIGVEELTDAASVGVSSHPPFGGVSVHCERENTKVAPTLTEPFCELDHRVSSEQEYNRATGVLHDDILWQVGIRGSKAKKLLTA
jgi:hypothetical protein